MGSPAVEEYSVMRFPWGARGRQIRGGTVGKISNWEAEIREGGTMGKITYRKLKI